MNNFNLLSILSVVTILFSCKKGKENINFHHEYFPLEEGKYVIYDVTKINHDDESGVHDTIVYRMKTVVGDTIIDNEGRIARKFYRHIYSNSQQKYIVQDLWTMIIDSERAELVEENERIIKLVFEPTKSKKWDKNAFNIQEEVMMFFENIHQSFDVNSLHFDSTLTVREDLESNAFHFYDKYEVYAKNIGLIKKCFRDFTTPLDDVTTPLVGNEIFYEIVEFGNE